MASNDFGDLIVWQKAMDIAPPSQRDTLVLVAEAGRLSHGLANALKKRQPPSQPSAQ